MSEGHSKFSPSGAHRWINCPGSVALCENIPRSPSGDAANLGTAVHYIGAKLLTDGYAGIQTLLNQHAVVDARGETEILINPVTDRYCVKITQKMIDDATTHFRVCEKQGEGIPRSYWGVEQRVDAAWIAPDLGGTVDFFCVRPMEKLYITDYKNGYGVVEVTGPNPQFMIYALCVLGENNVYGVGEVTLCVVQPNAPHSEGTVRTLTLSVEEVYAWGEDVLKPAIKLIQDGNAPLCAGPQCKWCPALQTCPEVIGAVEIASTKKVGQVSSLMDIDTAMVLAAKVTAWAKAVNDEAFIRLTNKTADAPKQWKLVAGRRTRSWASPEALIAENLTDSGVPKEKLFNTKLKTPAQMEKALGKDKRDLLAPHIGVKHGTSMVPVDDPRPNAIPTVDEMFNIE